MVTTILPWELATVFAASFIVCALLMLTQRWHGKLSLDHDLAGTQKVHQNPVPRVGGIGVIAGLLVGAAMSYSSAAPTESWAFKLLLCAVPAFAGGLIEDLTKRVGVRTRLLASFASAALASWLLDATLLRLDTPGIDQLMVWSPAALLFTCFAVGGMTNAVNIIDGLNGLASGAVALMLAGLAGIAWQAGDMLVMELCLWGIAAMAGFLCLNYPFGRIFLGDGGAYLAGFWLAECAVLLLHRNHGVATWAVLLCVMYPAWETIYSMYRRQFKDKTATGAPDSDHLHHLVLNTVQKALGDNSPAWLRHGMASAAGWILVALCQIGGILSASMNSIAFVLTVAFGIVYVGLYRAITDKENKIDEKAADRALELN